VLALSVGLSAATPVPGTPAKNPQPNAQQTALANCICTMVIPCLPDDQKNRAAQKKRECKLKVTNCDEHADALAEYGIDAAARANGEDPPQGAERDAAKAMVKPVIKEKSKGTAGAAGEGEMTFLADAKNMNNVYFKKLVVIEETNHTAQQDSGARLAAAGVTTGDPEKDKKLQAAWEHYLEVEAQLPAVKFGQMKVNGLQGDEKKKAAAALHVYMRSTRNHITELCMLLGMLGGLPAGPAKDMDDKMEACKKDGRAVFNAAAALTNQVLNPPPKQRHEPIPED